MSYVVLTDPIPDAKKFTIVIWARANRKSLLAARAEYEQWRNDNTPGKVRPPLIGVVPFVIIGNPRFGKKVESSNQVIGTVPGIQYLSWDCFSCAWHNFGDPTTGGEAEVFTETGYGEDKPVEPSYIGIDCTAEDGLPRFSVNIVMPNGEELSVKSSPVETGFTSEGGLIYQYITDPGGCGEGSGCENGAGIGNHPQDGDDDDPIRPHGCWPGILAFSARTITSTFEPAPFSPKADPEVFRCVPLGDASNGQGQPDGDYGQVITEDEWHPYIFSLDLTNKIDVKGGHVVVNAFGRTPQKESGEAAIYTTNGARTGSAARMFIAYGDNRGVHNLQGKKLSWYWPSGYKDKNAAVTVSANRILGETTTTGHLTADDCFGFLQTNDNLQDFTPEYKYTPTRFSFDDKLSFPGNEDFVDRIKHCEMGEFYMWIGEVYNPVNEAKDQIFITDRGRPAPPSRAKEYFGRKADVILHGVHNWQKGINTGSTADHDGAPVGEIDPYKPDPNLYGDQGK